MAGLGVGSDMFKMLSKSKGCVPASVFCPFSVFSSLIWFLPEFSVGYRDAITSQSDLLVMNIGLPGMVTLQEKNLRQI